MRSRRLAPCTSLSARAAAAYDLDHGPKRLPDAVAATPAVVSPRLGALQQRRSFATGSSSLRCVAPPPPRHRMTTLSRLITTHARRPQPTAARARRHLRHAAGGPHLPLPVRVGARNPTARCVAAPQPRTPQFGPLSELRPSCTCAAGSAAGAFRHLGASFLPPAEVQPKACPQCGEHQLQREGQKRPAPLARLFCAGCGHAERRRSPHHEQFEQLVAALHSALEGARGQPTALYFAEKKARRPQSSRRPALFCLACSPHVAWLAAAGARAARAATDGARARHRHRRRCR